MILMPLPTVGLRYVSNTGLKLTENTAGWGVACSEDAVEILHHVMGNFYFLCIGLLYVYLFLVWLAL